MKREKTTDDEDAYQGKLANRMIGRGLCPCLESSNRSYH